MGFVKFCVGLVICLLLYIASGIVGIICAVKNDEAAYIISWIVSTIGFGVCLTILLYQNGIIK